MAKQPIIKTLAGVPEAAKKLPKHAKEIFMNAFNNAWEQYKNPEKRLSGTTKEETAFRVAWSAVKKEYRKDEETWVKKD